MENMNGKVERMARRNARRRLWQRFVAIPAAIVVFVTTYALILPAIALERDTYCGQEAHTHTDECYTAQLACGYEDGAVMQSTQTVTALACTVSAHHHTEECFDENGSVICGIADYFVHTHTTDCFNTGGELVCPLPEVEAHTHTDDCYAAELVNVCGLAEEESHTHTDACYTVVSHPEMICGQAESAGHWHDENCYTPVENTFLVCGLAESAGHVHGEGCWITTILEDGTEVTELACGLPESAGHTHTDACYVTETTLELTCGLAEGEGHTHTDACYINVEDVELTCGLPESAGHTHTDACYVTEMRLVCGKPEVILHSHNEDCYTTTVLEDGTEVTELTCTQTVVEEHVHSAECFTTYEEVVERTHEHTDLCYIQVLTCTLPEHEHTDACYDKPEEELPETAAEPEAAGEPADGGDADPETTAEPETAGEPADGGDSDPETTAEPEATDEPETAGEPEATDDPETTAEPEAAGEPADGETAEPEYICGMEEHTHSDSCYTVTVAEDGTETSELICEKPEHTHGETCLPAVIVEEEPQPEVEIVEEDTPHFQLPVLICGLAEHEHSTNCMDENMVYACGVTPHTHTGACYAIPDMEGVSPILVCQKHEHFHTEACYDETGALICPIEAHTHDVACFALPEGVEDPDEAQPVYYCGMEEHTHADSCYDESGELICEKTEHTHDDSCRVAPTYYCGFEAHTHSEACLDANGEPVCGLPEHEHTDECLVEPTWYCGYEEHTHDETCYDENGELVCILPEHTHDAACLIDQIWYCGFEAHAHGESCYDENGELICGMEEHIHTADCRVEHFTQIAMAEGVMVTAKYTSEAGFPADAVLQVVRFADGEHYEARVNEAENVFYAANPDQIFQPRALLNIGFYLPDGTEVEPIAPVDVTVQMLDENGLAEGEQYTVIHYGAAGTELLDAEHTDSSVNFSADSFSDFIIGDDEDPSDGGSNVADNGQNETSGDTASETSGEEETVPPIRWSETLPNWLVGSFSQSSANSDNGIMTIASGDGGTTHYEHNKYIDYLGDNKSSGQDNTDTSADEQTVTDDLYRLYLDMEGKSEPVDLVIVIDRSNSMSNTMNGKTRWKTVYDILEGTNSDGSDGLLYQFLKQNEGKTSNKEKNFVSVVWFAGVFSSRSSLNNYGAIKHDIPPSDSKEGGTVLGWTSSYTHQGTTNYEISPYKGDAVACTNYVAGLYQAHLKLNNPPEGTEGHRKVVVFMSDGIPVYYYMYGDMDWDSPGSMHRYGGGSEGFTFTDTDSGISLIKKYIGHSPAKSFYESPYFNETLKIFKGVSGEEGESHSFVSKHPDIAFHTVAIDLSTKINGWDRTTLLKDMAESYKGGTMYKASNADGLKKYLQAIMFPAGVTISDDLSDYVELYGDLPDIKVTATNKNTKLTTTLWSYLGSKFTGSGTISGTYPAGSFEGTAYTNIVESVTYDASTGKISVKFKDDYCLSGDYTYTLSFNVRLTQEAYDAYAKYMNESIGNYDGVSGEEGTDYGGTNNQTSSLKPGFYSNNEATVVYKIGDPNDPNRPGGTLYYKHPVVQAWASRFKFLKTDMDGTPLPGIPFQLEKKDSSGAWAPYTPPGMAGKLTVDTEHPDWYLTGTNGTIDFGCLECGEYRLMELVPDEYVAGAVAMADGRQRQWMTFTVDKGRIIEVKPALEHVKWEGGEDDKTTGGQLVSNMTVDTFRDTVNSKPNTQYFADKATVTVRNEPVLQHLDIYKTDESGEKHLSGAKFELHKYNKDSEPEPWTALKKEELEALIKPAGAVKIEETEDGKAYLVSDSNGLVFTGDLPYGRYRLCEAQSPLDYDRSEKYVYFTVTEEDGVQLITADGEPADTGIYAGLATLEDAAGDREKMTLTVRDKLAEVKWVLKKQNDSSLPLAGASFELYGPYDDPIDPFDAAEHMTERLYTGTTEQDTGLLQGTGEYAGKDLPKLTAEKYYYLVETEAPAGFNLLSGPIQMQAKEIVADATGERKMQLHVKSGGSSPQILDPEMDGDTAVYTVKVTNTTGYELPESGGIGTTIFYMSGLALMALAGALLCGRKRRSCG